MSFRNCIDKAAQAGELTAEQANRAREIFQIEAEQLAADLGDDAAQAEAGVRTMERLEAEVLHNKRQVRLQQQAARRVHDQVIGAKDPAGAAADLIEHFGSQPWASVVTRFKVIRGRAHALMSDFILKFERDLISRTPHKADLQNVVREAFGQDTGDASAKAMAAAWSEAAEFLRRRFNAAGGAIAKRNDWGLPQKHDIMALRGVAMDDWIKFVEARIDRTRMPDDLTGRPITAEALRARLVETYHAITTEDWSRREPGGSAGRGSKMANQRADRRFLVFRDADTWMQYQERFGSADAFSAMMEHIDGMARDVSALEVLGPNPSAMMQYVRDLVERDATMRDANNKGRGRMQIDHARGKLKLMDDMWSMHSGASSAPVDGRLSRWVATIANLKVAAQLGSAFLSAISDTGFTRLSRKMVGMDGAVPLGRIVSLMKPGSAADKRAAIRLGLVAEGAANLGAAQARYAGEFVGHEWARRLADLTLRWSLLSPWTQAGRWSFGMEFMGFAADNAKKPWKALPDLLRDTLKRHGFHAGSWDTIRATALYEPEAGATFLRPEDISTREGVDKAHADALADQYLGMILTETEFAVPSASLRGRSFLVSQNQSGTFVGTVLRSLSMYKSFPSTVMILYTGRGAKIAAEAGGLMAGRFAAKMVVTTTLLGALALQLKEISKGRDPRPMTDGEFWGAAMLQGGGLGIFGDFLGSDVNRFGGGLAPTLAGPLGQLADDVRRLTIGNVMQYAAQEETNLPAESMRFVRQNTPGGSIWYMRLAYERMLLDEIEEVVDRDASGRFRRAERRARSRGQGYWWAPGDTLPERAPDLTTALDPAPQ